MEDKNINYDIVNNELITLMRNEKKDSVMYNFYYAKLIKQNEALIEFCASKFKSKSSQEFEDLKSELRLAMIESLNSYKIDSKASFATYAMNNMYNYALKYLKYNNIVKISTSKFKKLYDAKLSLEAQGFTPTRSQIATMAGLNEQEEIYLLNMLTQESTTISMDTSFKGKDSKRSTTIGELFTSETNLSTEYNKTERLENLATAIKFLPKLQKQVLYSCYYEEKPLRQIAQDLNHPNHQHIAYILQSAQSNLKLLTDWNVLKTIKLLPTLKNISNKNKLNPNNVHTILKQANVSNKDLLTLIDLTMLKNDNHGQKHLLLNDYTNVVITHSPHSVCRAIEYITKPLPLDKKEIEFLSTFDTYKTVRRQRKQKSSEMEKEK